VEIGVMENINVNPMAMVAGIATGQLSSKRITIRPTRKKPRPGMTMIGRELNKIYDFWRPRGGIRIHRPK